MRKILEQVKKFLAVILSLCMIMQIDRPVYAQKSQKEASASENKVYIETDLPQNKSISLNEVNISLVKGQRFKLDYELSDNGTLSKANKKIIVIKNGELIGKNIGTAELFAKKNGRDYKLCITVLEAGFEQKEYSVNINDVFEPKFQSYGLGVVYKIPDKYIANLQVTDDGKIMALKEGVAEFEAVVNTVSYAAKVRISNPNLKDQNIAVEVGKRKKIKILNCYERPEWKSEDVSVAMVKNGKIKGMSKGKTIVKAMINGKEISCKVYVNECKLSHRTLVLKKGDTKRVGILGVMSPDYNDIWQIAGKDKGIIELSKNGTITAKQSGNAAVYTEVEGKKYKIRVKVLKQESEVHQHQYVLLETPQGDSCDTKVEFVYRCECGSEYVDRKAIGHEYKLVKQEPTAQEEENNPCLRKLVNTYECIKCGEIKEEYIEGRGHIFEIIKTVPSTCNTAAYDLLQCKNCQIQEKEYKDTEDYPLLHHELSQIVEDENEENLILWHCAICQGIFIENSDGSFSEYKKKETSSSSMSKSSSSSSMSKSSSSSSMSKSSSSSSTSKSSSSSSRKSSSSSSSNIEHTHSLLAENYVNDQGTGTVTGYECAVCHGRWYQGYIDQKAFDVIVYNSNYPNDTDILNGEKKQAYNNDFMTLSLKKTGFVTPAGYRFLGWGYRKETAAVDVTASMMVNKEEIISSGSFEGVLYAKWEYIEYSISYTNIYGAENSNPKSYTIKNEEIELLPIEKAGYIFKGWYDESNKIVTKLNALEMRNRYIAACWEKIEYSITYQTDLSECPVPVDNIVNYNVESDDIILKNPIEPTGYIFKGWSLDENQEINKNIIIKKGSIGDRNYVAHWEKVKYKLLYALDFGENSIKNPSQYCISDEIVLDNPTRKFYTFGGWYKDYSFLESSRVSRIDQGTTGNILLYAKWIKNKFDYSVKNIVTCYDGLSYGITVSCNTVGTRIYYKDVNSDIWSTNRVRYKNAGEYETEYKLEKDDYETVYGKAKVSIDKALGVAVAPVPLNLTYTGEAQKLISKGFSSTGDIYYSEGMTSVGEYSLEIPVATAAGTYYVWYYSKGDMNHYDSPKKSVTIIINKAVSSVSRTPLPKELIYNKNAQALVYEGRAQGGEMEYALGNQRGSHGEYSQLIPTASQAGTYYVYYRCKGDVNHQNSIEEYVTVEIKKADSYIEVPPTPQDLTYSGGQLQLINAGTSENGTIMYGVVSDKEAAVSYSSSIPYVINAGTYYVFYYVKGDTNHKDSSPAYIKVNVKKATGYVFSAPVAENAVYNGSEQNLISAGSSITGTMYYKLENGEYSRNIPKATNAGEYRIYYKAVGDNNHNDSAEGSIKVIIATKEMKVKAYDAQIKYTGNKSHGDARVHVSEPFSDYEIKYGLTEGNCSLSEIPSYSEIGTYTVFYEVKAANYTPNKGAIIISIVKGDGSCIAPKALTNLSYTGDNITLIKEGYSETGTMYYKLEGEEVFRTALPTAFDNGNYRVYYYSKGNSNYNDTAVKFIDVNIAKAKLKVTFENTYFKYDGACHYPTVKVSSDAKMPDSQQLRINYKFSEDEAWKYHVDTAYINGSIFEKLPATWVPQKVANASLGETGNNSVSGKYTIYYQIRVSPKLNTGAQIVNFDTELVNCSYTIDY